MIIEKRQFFQNAPTFPVLMSLVFFPFLHRRETTFSEAMGTSRERSNTNLLSPNSVKNPLWPACSEIFINVGIMNIHIVLSKIEMLMISH